MGCNGDVGIFKAPQVILSVQFETTGLDQCFSHLKGHRSHLDILLTCRFELAGGGGGRGAGGR